MSEGVVFRPADLLPAAWRRFAADGPVRMFNPGLLRDGDGWIFAYRVVAPDGRRRIALCRLDAQLRVRAGSPYPWSDFVRFPEPGEMPDVARHWFADPRLYRLEERLFIYWNTGWHEPRNYQFVQELDPATLTPRGGPRELVLRGERQKLEKNWTFFDDPTGRRHFALYSILPHRVLEYSLAGDGPIEFAEIAATEWQLTRYPPRHGGLRGGAPPVLADGVYWTVCHSVHDGIDGYRYAPALYRFEAVFPFRPRDEPVAPVELIRPSGSERAHPRLNPAVGEVMYPCGAAREGRRWLISHGIDDEHCAISIVAETELLAKLQPLVLREPNS